MPEFNVPFFRPELTDIEIDEVVETLRSGWLTTGPKVSRFENDFAAAVHAKYAVAVNSCTAALHLAVEAMELKQGQGVLVPTMTFAATAEVIRYQGAIPILVDCDPLTTNMDLQDAGRKMCQPVVGMIPVHVGGMMMDIDEIQSFAAKHGLWVVEDAAHAFPSAWRRGTADEWQRCGEGTSIITCFSYYANKTITTGEGGMAVTNDHNLAKRIRLMSLHGLSHDAWGRYSNNGKWDYKIVAPGFKYNMTDVAASIGIHQLKMAEEMRLKRESIARRYLEAFADIEEIELPYNNSDRIHSWHLFPIRLNLDRLSINRNLFMDKLKKNGVGCSMHWRPLHLHPYYKETFNYRPEDFPIATGLWKRLLSLPIFPSMREDEIKHTIKTVRKLCALYMKQSSANRAAYFKKTENSKEKYVAAR